MKFAFFTLGCKVNQFETQAMQGICLQRGHKIVDFDQSADVYIINTCTVTSISDRKSRQAAGRARRQNADAVVALCGCYAEGSPDKARASADIVWGNRDHAGLIEAIEGLRSREYKSGNAFEQLPSGGLEGKTRALLKVQDGCANYCAYCKIPYVRGPVRSIPLEAAAQEAARLAAEGYREIVVTGIEISSYGKGRGESGDLATLIEHICAASHPTRVRLGSLYPDTATEEFCQRMAKLPNLCRQFHLSLQSGCDRTLASMRRKYTTAFFAERLASIRNVMPDAMFTTDLICGFPGETDEDFAQTLDFLEACRFLNVHIFPYSRREGTVAASLPGQLSAEIKRGRCARAAEFVARIRGELLADCVGRQFEVLFESPGGQRISGYSREYLPFETAYSEKLAGNLFIVTAARVSGETLEPSFEEESHA